MGRKAAREGAMKLLFQMELNGTSPLRLSLSSLKFYL